MNVDHSGFLEFEPEVVALAGALADSGEDGEAAVLRGDVVDEFLDDDGFADARAAEEAGLAALEEGLDEVDDLHAGLEHLLAGRLLVEGRRLAVNGHALGGLDRAELVDRLADHVEHAAQRFAAHGHGDRAAEVDGIHAAHHAFGRFHGHAAHAPLAQVLLHLKDDVDGRGNVEAVADYAQRLIDERHPGLVELHVDGGAGDLNYFADVFCHKFPVFNCCPKRSSLLHLNRGCAAHNLDNFLGDRRLTRAVHGQGVLVDHVRSVVGRRIHGCHARGLLGGHRFQERVVQLRREIAGEAWPRRFPAAIAHKCNPLRQCRTSSLRPHTAGYWLLARRAEC